jgi:zinc transporter 1/2/3
VLLGTALIPFLIDSHDGLQKLTAKHFTFAELLAISGYFITVLGDLVIASMALRATAGPCSASALDRVTAAKSGLPEI